MKPQAQLDLDKVRNAAALKCRREEAEAQEASHSGWVVSVSRDRIWLRNDDGSECEVELSMDSLRAVVGDKVLCSRISEERSRLVALGERHTVIRRPDPHNAHVELVVAANVDVAVIITSIRRPQLRAALVDRFLIAIERGLSPCYA